MKKNLLILPFLLLTFTLFSEESPIKSREWPLNKYEVADDYREQDVWVYIEGEGKIHYWLYDTYHYKEGYNIKNGIFSQIVPGWIKSMGYVIDFDNIRSIFDYQYKYLTNSVKALMKERGCDISVALITSEPSSFVIINDYDRNTDLYNIVIFPLIKY